MMVRPGAILEAGVNVNSVGCWTIKGVGVKENEGRNMRMILKMNIVHKILVFIGNIYVTQVIAVVG